MGSSITPKIMDQVAAAGKEEKLPPGFRFHPTDEELITYYLTKRISEPNFSARAIADVDLNKCEPWDLPGKAKMGEKEWYFFSLRDRKYPTGVRTNRATNAGYWKTTGKDKEIFSCSTHGHGSDLVGMKKTLVFYKGRAPRGEKTNWVMHEYRLHSKPSSFKAGANKDEWVVCRVFAKSSGGKKYPSSQARAASHYTIDMGPAMMPSLNLHGDPLFHHFGIGRSHHGLTAAELGDLARFARGQPGHSLPIQPQLNFPPGGGGGGGFTLSGLNLNLGAQPQPGAMRPMPFLLPQQQLAAAEPDSSVLTNCILSSAAGGGFNVSGGSSQAAASGPRFQNVDNCLDLEGYWPTY